MHTTNPPSPSNQAMQRLLGAGMLPTKLVVNQPGDAYEQESARVADGVMRMPEATKMQRSDLLQRQSAGPSTAQVVAQQNAGGQPQLQRTCDPQPLARPEFLKVTGLSAKDAPFGLTRLAFGKVQYPAVLVEEVPAKKKGAKPVWTLSPTTTVLPDPIPSRYTVGIFEEETATAIIVPQGPCQGRYDRATYWVVGNMGNLLRDGELEHCADYQYAFDISLVKFAAAVNELAGKDHCTAAKDKCEESFRRKLEKKTGVAPDQWPDVFQCLAKKSETVRDKRQLLHNPSTRTELTKDCKVRMVMTGLPGLGTPSSAIIKCPEMGFTVPAPKTPAPAKPASPKPAAKLDAGDK